MLDLANPDCDQGASWRRLYANRVRVMVVLGRVGQSRAFDLLQMPQSGEDLDIEKGC